MYISWIQKKHTSKCQRPMNYHIVIDEGASRLYKSCDSKCHILCRTVRNWTSKFGKPASMIKTENHPIMNSSKDVNKILSAIAYERWKCSLPGCPGFSPHLGFISLIWCEVVTVETIASINLSREKRYIKVKYPKYPRKIVLGNRNRRHANTSYFSRMF